MAVFAIIQGGVVVNTVVVTPVIGTANGWVEIDSLNPQPSIGWTFNGSIFSPPTPNPLQVNQSTIISAVASHLTQVEAWIAANPSGAVLTAAQTLFLAKMLDGLGLLILGLLSTVGQSQ